MLITIDISELENGRNGLSDFLRSRIHASITIKGKTLFLDLSEEKLSPRDVKTLVKSFLHREGLSEIYKVNEEKEVVKIFKRGNGGERERRPKTKGTPPSSYDTLPYFFPNRPQIRKPKLSD
ncbi:MAG: hypothetical protein QG670_1762 [Thermoproteota archaeon]|nr:hypothetical protein [Thermoproteota archaeon]